MIDWNWFFSALAQSAAAIVGIFGAFVITKILNNQAAFSQKKNRANEVLAGCQRVVDSANDLAFDWYNKRNIERELKKLDDLLEDDDSKSPEQVYDELRFPIFYERSKAISTIGLLIERRRQRIERERQEKERKAAERRALGPMGFFEPDTMQQLIPDLPNYGLEVNLEKERDAIDQVIRDARHQARMAADILDAVTGNPESSPQITFALALVTILFYIGVIYPLSFMPMPQNAEITLTLSAFWSLITSIKGVLLLVVSLVFTSILVVFFWLNANLRYSKELLSQLDDFTSIDAYSPYFAIMEENERAGSAAAGG